MKILYYLNNLGMGGSEKTAELYARYLNKNKFEVHLVYRKGTEHSRLKNLGSSGVLLTEMESPETELQTFIDNNKIDLLHVFRTGFCEFPSNGIHVNVPYFIETNIFGIIDFRSKIDKTLFLSNWLKEYSLQFIKNYQPQRFDYCFCPAENPAHNNKFENLPFNKNSIILGRCGRPDNGIYHSLNVRAAKKIIEMGYDVSFLTMAAPSNMIKDLEDWNIPYKNIEPTVDWNIVSTFYNSIDILAHARADGETQGINICEAMMHGKPTVTHIAEPSIPGMGVFQAQSWIVKDGNTGFVVENNLDEYVDALLKLINNPTLRLDMGGAALAIAGATYGIQPVINKLESIYLSLA